MTDRYDVPRTQGFNAIVGREADRTLTDWKSRIPSKTTCKWILVAVVLTGVTLAVIWSLWKTCAQRTAHAKRRRVCADYCRLRATEGETIFVSVPSYRDPLAAKTVVDLFEKARCPRRVFVGVCSQIDAGRDSSFSEAYNSLARRRKRDGPMSDHVRVLEISHEDARGPTYARSLIETELYRGETYYLMVDSHTAFAPDWDDHCVRMLRACPSGKKSVLSTYPPDYSRSPDAATATSDSPPDPNDEDSDPLPRRPAATYLRFKCFNPSSGMPEIEGPSCVGVSLRPHPSAFWGACFSFGYGETQIGRVPYDPHSHFVFLGEETCYAARLFTHGIDVFSPPATVAFHRWDRGYRSTFWELLDSSRDFSRAAERRKLESAGNDRVRVVLGMIAPLQCASPERSLLEIDRYGLGKERTLPQYEQFAGFSLVHKTASGRARMGLAPNPSSEEILAKFGNVARYRAEAQRLASFG